jgi:ribosomal protein L33
LLSQVKPKNPRNLPQKLQLNKYDPIVNRHVPFIESGRKLK